MFRNPWTNTTGCFRLRTSVRVIKAATPGSPEIATVAPGSLLVVEGRSSIPGFVEISLGGQMYHVFYRDLKKSAEHLRK